MVALINITQFGVEIGVMIIIFGVVYIIFKDRWKEIVKKDKRKFSFSYLCKNWSDKAFYTWGITNIITGILLILNSESEFIICISLIDSAIFFGQIYYYNKKAKTRNKIKKK